ncbi:protein kinase domain-containing protein [Endozoicomonas numazuensis]|uniref:Protein kinase domain-containing protein n=1 Tax=Endozoicomonas numazuensis TaxID=1137799 RepID=A0A081NKH1_9GAMM|nr:protein kinase [Endozoicomonas numazuensis]KEQ18944.1 hypothetical protein GZ78_02505 [Endozoicomonas numazuensis]
MCRGYRRTIKSCTTIKMAAISLGKATSLAFGKAKAFCRSVVVVLMPTRLKKRLSLFKPTAPPLGQRSIAPMRALSLSVVLKGDSFPEIDEFKNAFKLRIRDILDDITAIEVDKAAELYSSIKVILLHRIDDCSSLDEILGLVKETVPMPYQQRLYVSFIQIGRNSGADLSLSKDSWFWLESMVPNESFEHVDALAHLHAQFPPISHGDLKPDNVLVTADSEAKLSDFRSAAFQVQEEIGWDDFTGNHGTAPPEFFDRSHGRSTKADMWAFGCVLYEMATGKALIQKAPTLMQPDDPVGYIRSELELALENLTPPELKDLLSHLLEIDPEKRFSSTDAINHPFWESGGIPIPDFL